MKTKFNCVDIDISETRYLCIQLTFPEPIRISGFGFTSANNFPHLDPAVVKIYCTAEKKIKDSEKDFKEMK